MASNEDDVVYDDLEVDEEDDPEFDGIIEDDPDLDGQSDTALEGAEPDHTDAIQGFFKHTEPVYTVSLHPTNQSMVISGGGDGHSYLWNAETGDMYNQLPSHADSVVASGFSHDGHYVAVGGMDGKVTVVESATGKHVITLDGPSEVTWLNWHPRGNVLLCGSEDGTMWLWQIPSGSCMNVFSGHMGSVSVGQFTPDGKSIVSGGDDGMVFVWDPKNATIKHRFQSGDARFLNGPITSLSIQKDSQVALCGSQDGSACLVQIQSGRILGSASKAEDSIETVAINQSSPLAALGSVDGTIAVWDLGSMTLRGTYTHLDAVTQVIWQEANPGLLTTCSMDQSVRVWDSRTGSCESTLIGHSKPILDMAIARDSSWCVTGSDDNSALVFSLT